MTASASTEELKNKIARRPAAVPERMSGFGDVHNLLEQMKGQLARALPRHLNVDRLARVALTEVRKTPLLARCTSESFAGALLTCAALGLEPGVSGEAYLVPFKNTRKGGIYEVQLIVGYAGMAKLYWQSPLARTLSFETVYENDHFRERKGLDPLLEHEPARSNRGKPVAWYAVATLTTGGSAFTVLYPEDVDRIRQRSRAKDDGPWKTDPDAMSKKTALRQLFKLLPKSPELQRALVQDEAVRTDLADDAIDVTPDYIDGEASPAIEASSAVPPAEGEPAPAAAEGSQPEPVHDGHGEIVGDGS